MVQIGISITKSTAFRNSTQEFSNVYFYHLTGSYPDAAGADGLIDELTTLEKGFHSSGVTFVRGRCWKQTGDKATSEMISQKNLSGTGSTSATSVTDKERAFLFRLRAGNDSRGNAVYLRKWYHSCGNGPGGYTPATGVVQNASSIPTGDRTTMETAVNPIRNIGAALGGWELCAKSGRQFNPGAGFQSHPYYEHHQMGDQWRAQ